MPDWTQVASEDFTTNTLSTNFVVYNNGTATGYTANSWMSAQVSVNTSTHQLLLNAKLTGGAGSSRVGGALYWTGGGGTPAIMKYGAWEVDYYTQNQAGYAPVLLMWPYPDNGVWPQDGEIDIIEMYTGDVKTSCGQTNLHLDTTAGSGNHLQIPNSHSSSTTSNVSAGNYQTDFTVAHTVRLEWQPDYVAVYIDGALVSKNTDKAWIPQTQPMRLTLQQEFYGTANSSITSLNANTVVTGMRAYTFTGTAPTHSKVLGLSDDFSTNDLATQWYNETNATVSGGQCSYPSTTSWNGQLCSTSAYDLTGSSLTAQVTPAGSSWTGMELIAGTSMIIMSYDAGTLSANLTQASTDSFDGTGIAYSATNHAWWRVRESAGTIYWDTSPDGATWTNRWSHAYTMDITALTVKFLSGMTSGSGTTYIDNVNPGGGGGGGGGTPGIIQAVQKGWTVPGSGTLTASVNITNTAGNLLVLTFFFANYTNSNLPHVTSVTDAIGNTWSVPGTPPQTNPPIGGSWVSGVGALSTGAAYCLNPAAIGGGAVTVSVTATSSSDVEGMFTVFECSMTSAAVDASAQGSTATTGTTAATPSVNIAGSDLVFTTVASDAAALSVGSPFTMPADGITGFEYAASSATGLTATYTATGSSHFNAESVIAFISASLPGTPTGLTVTGVTSSSVSLAWTAPAAGPVTGYHVYQGGTLAATTGSVYCTVTGLSASTAYTFTVAAYNASGTGSQSSAVTATTSGTLAPSAGPAVAVRANWPQLILEGGFLSTQPVQAAGTFILDDAANGILGTNTLGTGETWTDFTAWVRSGNLNRPASRQQGPLYAYQPGTLSVVLNNKDGRFDPDNLGGPYVAAGETVLTAMVPVRLRAIWNGTAYALYAGFTDSWNDDGQNYAGHYAEATMAATDAQKVLTGINLAVRDTPVGADETSGARVDRILTAAGWYTGNGKRIIATGDSTVQATTFGEAAWNLMQVTADSEIGELYLNGAGTLVFRNRQGILEDARSNTSQVTFSDNPATGLAYRSVTRTRDDTTIANDVQATRTGGTLQEAFDQASISKYLFPRTYQRTDLILTDDKTTMQWAQWVLYIAKNDEDRFDQIVIYPLRDPANLWPQCLGREIGDRITIIRNPPGVGSPISRDCFIRGIAHAFDVSAGTWATTWTLQDATRYGSFMVLNDAILGQLDENALAY